MEQFPVEILHKIFCLLLQNEKVECLLVCHRWSNIIKSRSLYHTLYIKDISTLNHLNRKLLHKPVPQAQVQSLILDINIHKAFRLDKLLTPFPSLKSIYLLGSESKSFQKTISPHPKDIKLEYITEKNSHTLTLQILSTCLCSRLKTLNVHATKRGIPGSLFITLLVNAPHLRELIMSAFSVSFNDLESLHATLPSLVTLELSDTHLLKVTIPDDDSIQPATNITSFALETSNNHRRSHTGWMHYIKIKYTNLISYKFNDPREKHHAESFTRNEVIPVIKGFSSQLKTLSLNLKAYGPDFFTSLDNNISNSNGNENENENDNDNNHCNNYNSNSNSNSCRIENLILDTRKDNSILHSLSNSSQGIYIQTLKLKTSKIDSFNWLRGLVSLKKLTFIFDHHQRERVEFNALLDMCPGSLESLSIRNAKLSFGINDRNRTYSIKVLALSNVPVPETMSLFISQSLPQLQDLRLFYCDMYGSHFSLPNHNLSLLLIEEGIKFRNTFVLLITGQEKTWYTSRKNSRELQFCKKGTDICGSTIYPASKSLPYRAWSGLEIMEFTCASVSTVLVIKVVFYLTFPLLHQKSHYTDYPEKQQ